MAGSTGWKRCAALRQSTPKSQMVIMMTAYGTTQTAIEAMKLGAYDYLLKPFDVPRLKQIVLNALKAARDMRQVVSINRCSNLRITTLASSGGSEAMQNVFKIIGQLGRQQRHGFDHRRKRTGQGISRPSRVSSQQRSGQPFLAIIAPPFLKTFWRANCLGHEKGAFTGASSAAHWQIRAMQQRHDFSG